MFQLQQLEFVVTISAPGPFITFFLNVNFVNSIDSGVRGVVTSVNGLFHKAPHPPGHS